MKTLNRILLLALLPVLLLTCATRLRAKEKTPANIPALQREFRAAWVATVANIDWPSRRGLSTAEQQAEMLAILDRAVELKLNSIIFQVRPHCDALYASELEPWSEYLTGTMGQAPAPFYDPLKFIVQEAHRRGLELHAWFNPYRALHSGSKGKIADSHISKIKPNIVRQYGKQMWLDPGDPDAVDHSIAVIIDVVRRYDIDGVHFDDYFYPYQIKDDQKQTVPFPDDASWKLAQSRGNTLNRDDWRRQNVDRMIHRLSTEIHKEKPHVRFGISPFGIWRPGHPPEIKGYDAYAMLYADAKKWLTSGWVDYITPQLYWKIDKQGQSYPILMQWWHEQNNFKRHLWPGNYTSRVNSPNNGNWSPAEITNQIKLTREQQGATGNVHFSMKALMDDSRGIAEALKEGPYRKPALVPATPWLGKETPIKPTLAMGITAGKRNVQFKLTDGSTPWLWAIRIQENDEWRTEIIAGHITQYAFPNAASVQQIAVSAVSPLSIEGPIAVLQLQK